MPVAGVVVMVGACGAADSEAAMLLPSKTSLRFVISAGCELHPGRATITRSDNSESRVNTRQGRFENVQKFPSLRKKLLKQLI